MNAMSLLICVFVYVLWSDLEVVPLHTSLEQYGTNLRDRDGDINNMYK